MNEPRELKLEKYAESPLFTEETVPAKLLNLHDTKPGVWGKIVVTEGQLEYHIPEFDSCQLLTSEQVGWIKPQQVHKVSPRGPVRFRIEFYRAP